MAPHDTIQVTLGSQGPLSYTIRVEVPDQQVAQSKRQKLQDMQKTVDKKGFRKGKVPLAVLEQQHGDQVVEEVLEVLCKQAVQPHLEEAALSPVQPVQLRAAPHTEAGAPWVCDATFEVYPRVTVDWSKVHVTEKVPLLDNHDIETMKQQLRRDHAEWTEVSRQAAWHDRVRIDFAGAQDGQPVASAAAKDFLLDLGAGQLIEGFEASVVDHVAGDTWTVSLSFPEQYHNQDMAGKVVDFTITLHAVLAADLPELNEAFIQKVGVSDGTEEALEDKLRERMTLHARHTQMDSLRQQLFEQLLAQHPNMDVPASLLAAEQQGVLREHVEAGSSPELGADDPDIMRIAHNRVSLSMLLRQHIQDHRIQLSQERYEAAVRQVLLARRVSSMLRDGSAVSDAQRAALLRDIQERVLEEQTLEHMLTCAHVEAHAMPFGDVIQ